MEKDSKIKTRTVSFRIPEDVLHEIEKVAKTKLISTNGLINQILTQYTSWDKYEDRITMFRVPGESLQHILLHLDEVRRGEAVDIIFNIIRDWTLVSKKKFDIFSCLDTLEVYCRMVGVSIEDRVSNGVRSFVIMHNLGQNASILISDLAHKIFWELTRKKIETELTKTTVIAKVTTDF
ncbi:hypothetical protein [Nitrosopumilus ureiphilus]|uniref:Uncharacterized protein n=1 Tax=Nitrosopumilus ureiphilus TaxID=1470067 RepID=A0A7D5R753_9ARCH|nr:hypothetical protein [Nitrosopumilus ureiphilus]QLH07457.1 hypothetical protein C5F50_10540 [Nitrosopumilus ureiphilus]